MSFPLFLLFFIVFSPVSRFALAETPFSFDHSEWDQFLKEFVNEKGEVNYRAAKEKPAHLENYLQKLKSIPETEFNQWPREERIALFINAYNAGLIQTILKHYPVKNVMAIPGIWEEHSIQMTLPPLSDKPRAYSLNQIQKEVLIQQFRDEKILFALGNAAKGSPSLQREAFVGPRLEGQLYLATRKFVNDPARNRISTASKKIILSRIFQWYGGDFLLNWGNYPEEERWKPQERAVLSFFAHYLEDSKKVEFLKEGEYKVKYDSFDWRLNDWQKA